MAIIHTKRNFICAYEALPEDSIIEIFLVGLDMDGNAVRRRLLTQPIGAYPQALEWALKMADMMASPVEIVTFTTEELAQRLLKGQG